MGTKTKSLYILVIKLFVKKESPNMETKTLPLPPCTGNHRHQVKKESPNMGTKTDPYHSYQ